VLFRSLAQLTGRTKDRRTRAHEIVMKCLLNRFPPEFVNRIDHVDTFNWISRETMPALVLVELERLNRRLGKHKVSLELTDSFRDFLSVHGYDKQFGARGLRRVMRRHLEFPLASFLLDPGNHIEGAREGKSVKLTADRNNEQVVFRHV